MSTTSISHRGPSRATRRFGYVVALTVNAVMLYAVNRWPGWDALPFLTADTVDVLDVVNASIIVNLAANVIFLRRDPPRLKAAGDLVSTAVGLIAMVAIWHVFPLDLSSSMERVVRVVLGIGLVGSVIGILSAIGRFVHPSPRTTVVGSVPGPEVQDQRLSRRSTDGSTVEP